VPELGRAQGRKGPERVQEEDRALRPRPA
jgi:hypothetical protein